MEDIPLPDDSVDVVLSNCVVNLDRGKTRCSPKPSACFDQAVDSPSPILPRSVSQRPCVPWPTPRLGPAASPEHSRDPVLDAELLGEAGFVDAEITDSHEVHDGFWSVIVRARKP